MASSFNKAPPFTYDIASQTWKPSIAVSLAPPLAVGEVLRVISWNIDFMEPFQPERVTAALKYLEEFLRDKSEPTIILLQEITENSLDTLLTSSWVKENFQISHTQLQHRPVYFTITLTPKEIETLFVFRVPLVMTYMERDGLFVDLPVSRTPTVNGNMTHVLRICNTHLESLQSGNNVRPLQLKQIAALLQPPPSPDIEIVAGLVGGDMNAISHNDENIHRRPEISLQDVYEISQKNEQLLDNDDRLGGREGYTWGYQPTCQYPPGRLDKIMFTGALKPIPVSSEPCMVRLGVGLKVEVQDNDPRHSNERVEVWVTDHFGIAATFVVLDE